MRWSTVTVFALETQDLEEKQADLKGRNPEQTGKRARSIYQWFQECLAA